MGLKSNRDTLPFTKPAMLQEEVKMNSKMTRRDALKLRTGTALSAAATPLLASSMGQSSAANAPSTVPGLARATRCV